LRELARVDDAKQLLAGHIGPHPVRHRRGGVSGDLAAQEVVALRMRKNVGSKMRVQRKKTMGKQSPEPVPDARLKRDECGRSP
jgi:hypothetical protein